MAKMKEIINTQQKEGVNPTEMKSRLEHSSLKRKITTQDKKKWDAKSKTMHLKSKCDFKTKHAHMHDGVPKSLVISPWPEMPLLFSFFP